MDFSVGPTVEHCNCRHCNTVAVLQYCNCTVTSRCIKIYRTLGKCSSDSYADDPRTRHPHTAELHANRVAAGGLCTSDGDCYSDFCTQDSICNADGPQMRTIAAGAYCQMDSDCSSGYCFHKRCMPADETSGRVASGGRCKTSDMCAPGSMCVHEFCKRPKDGMRKQVIPAGSVHFREACWMNGQCILGRCLARQCRVPAYLIERWSGAYSIKGSAIMLMLSLLTIWCTRLCLSVIKI